MENEIEPLDDLVVVRPNEQLLRYIDIRHAGGIRHEPERPSLNEAATLVHGTDFP